MLGHDAVAAVPCGTVIWTQDNLPPVTQVNPVNAIWRNISGEGYCGSITLQVITTSSGTAAGVTVQVNSFDVMYEPGGLV